MAASLLFRFALGGRVTRRRNGAPDIAPSGYAYGKYRSQRTARRNRSNPYRKSRPDAPSAAILQRRADRDAAAARRRSEQQERIEAQAAARGARLAELRDTALGFLAGIAIALADPHTARHLLFVYFSGGRAAFGRGVDPRVAIARALRARDPFAAVAAAQAAITRKVAAQKVGAIYRANLLKEMGGRLTSRTGRLFGSVRVIVRPTGRRGVFIGETFPATFFVSKLRRGQYAYVLNATAPEGRKARRNFITRARFRTRAQSRRLARVVWRKLS
ncbi:MAG: hypothetical protein F4Y04_03730 [Chloroflexi bacterium]|nr:hypothetical protein [Chloroflexota bacterium]